MKLRITNKEIFFAIESVWPLIHYKLKSQLNALVTANSEDDFEQEVDIDTDSFIQIMKATSAQPQGIAKDINPIIHSKLKTVILKEATPIFQQVGILTANVNSKNAKEEDKIALEEYKEANKEIINIATAIQEILISNETILFNKILNGKTQILS